MSAQAWLYLALVLLAALPLGVFCLQVMLALLPARDKGMPRAARPRVAVLVPAHNESSGLRAPLAALRAQLADGDRLLVVADNCDDDTAAVAAAAGAEVIERHDPERRGKGYALDYGVRHLAAAPPQVVVVVDADCLVAPGALEWLARACRQHERPVQACYLMHAPPAGGLRAQVAEFAWCVKNRVRPLGYARLGLPCQLMGSGMAFPWPLICRAQLASGHLVEDLELGLALAALRRAPRYLPQAVVSSRFPASAEGVRTQRTRWEHGHLGMMLTRGPRLLLQGLMSANGELLALALDLFVPPLALLALALLLLGAAGAVAAAAAGTLWPWGLGALLPAVLAAAVLLAWAGFGRRVIGLASLAWAPCYALGKIPVYLGFLVRRQSAWVRSKRDLPPA